MTKPPRPNMAPPAASGPLGRLDQTFSRWINAWNPYDPARLQHRDLQPVEVEESGIRRKATWMFLVFFVLFLVWAFTAPIDAGVSVQGNVVVIGNRKSVQHPSGGVVEEILVKEGDEVRQGDVLLRVNQHPVSKVHELMPKLRKAQFESALQRSALFSNPDASVK